MSDWMVAILFPAGLLIGLGVGWHLGRSGVRNIIVGSRELRSMLKEERAEHHRLHRKHRQLTDWVAHTMQNRRARRPAQAASAVEAPPQEALDQPRLPQEPIVMNGDHARRVRKRWASRKDGVPTLWPGGEDDEA